MLYLNQVMNEFATQPQSDEHELRMMAQSVVSTARWLAFTWWSKQ